MEGEVAASREVGVEEEVEAVEEEEVEGGMGGSSPLLKGVESCTVGKGRALVPVRGCTPPPQHQALALMVEGVK